MALQKLDKKQVPQVVAMAVLSCGLLGYFAKQMITPSPAAAHTATSPPTATPSRATSRMTSSGTSSPSSVPAADAPPAGGDAPPPLAPGTRDPFEQTISSMPTSAAPSPSASPAVSPSSHPKIASFVVPHTAPLPALTPDMISLRPLPTVPGGVVVPPAPALPPTAPTWMVTGVLASGTEHIAILRSGDQRRFVREGDWLDSQFQVGHVGRDTVTLQHGAVSYTLPLGATHSSAAGSGVVAPPAIPSTQLLAPSAISTLPIARLYAAPKLAARKLAGFPLLASAHGASVAPTAPHVAKVVMMPLQTLTAPLLTPGSFATPTVRPADFSLPAPKFARHAIVKVAAYHSKSIKSLAKHTAMVPPGMLPVGTLAPDFALRTLSGNAVALSQFKGRPVVLTFWASWVDESGSAVPHLQQIAKEGHAALVSVGSWDSRPALLSFAGTHGISPQGVLYDESVPNQSVAVRLFHAPDVPTCYVLDRDGHVVAAFVGFGPNTAEAVRATLLTLETS